MEAFKSTQSIAKVIKIFLIIDIGWNVLYILLSLTELLFFPTISFAEDMTTDGELIFALGLLGLGLAALVAFLGTIISFLIWLYRSYKNLTAFDVSELNASAGWAVGCWFIPFINLIVPLKIVNEVYHGSNPENIDNEIIISDNSTTLWHGAWWALWLIGNFLSNISFRISWNAETQNMIELATKIDMVSSLIWIMSAYLLYEIVDKITKWQEESGRRLKISEPPKPPNFNK